MTELARSTLLWCAVVVAIPVSLLIFGMAVDALIVLYSSWKAKQ